MPVEVHQIATAEIDALAIARDRLSLDAEAMTELRLSIAASGVRSPVELFEIGDSGEGLRYGLISGFRRLAAVRALHDLTGETRYATIPAFIRDLSGGASAYTAMVEENEVREALSPWERGRVAVTARTLGHYETIEEAVDGLYPSANAAKRSRLRTLARVVEELDGDFVSPERLTQRQIIRIANALRDGFGPLLRAALEEEGETSAAAQWAAILPVLEEAENTDGDAPAQSFGPAGRRQLAAPRSGLSIRRERLRDGYALRFSGPAATPSLIDLVFEEIERLLEPD